MRTSPATRYLLGTFTPGDPPMTQWARERMKANKPSFGPNGVADSNDPVNPTTIDAVGCFPPGVPRIYLHPFPMEIVQVPGKVIMIFEFNHFVRQIYTDGRQHPKDLSPTWMGDSIGQWDGDTLVVDTVGLRDESWLDSAGHEHSAQLRVVERFRRLDAGSLEIVRTLTDPIALAKPYTRRGVLRLNPSYALNENMDGKQYDCSQFMVRKPAFGEGEGGLLGIADHP